MLSNSILFQDLMIGHLVNAHGTFIIHELQHLNDSIKELNITVEVFKKFITTIVTPLLIISGLTTGVRS